MPGIYAVFDKTPVPMGAHLVSGHVKVGNKAFDGAKSFFTDSSGTALGTDDAVKLLVKAKSVIATLTLLKKDAEKTVTGPAGTVQRISADAGKLGYAVTWSEQVGSDKLESVCKWICLFVTSTQAGGRHQWVTAYPATESYVEGKKK